MQDEGNPENGEHEVEEITPHNGLRTIINDKSIDTQKVTRVDHWYLTGRVCSIASKPLASLVGSCHDMHENSIDIYIVERAPDSQWDESVPYSVFTTSLNVLSCLLPFVKASCASCGRGLKKVTSATKNQNSSENSVIRVK
jgi:hypothetical protein